MVPTYSRANSSNIRIESSSFMSMLNVANSSSVFYVITLGDMDEDDTFDQQIAINWLKSLKV